MTSRGVDISVLADHRMGKDLLDRHFESCIYRQEAGRALKLLVKKPPGWNPSDRRTAILWIHGGSWIGGEPEYFLPHSNYFAMRGMVACSVEYRLLESKGGSRGSTLIDCLQDCRAAVRYVRERADAWGVDPDKIVVAGDSAGGHLAACLATAVGFDIAREDAVRSGQPNAVVICNGIVDMTGKWREFVPSGQVATHVQKDDAVEGWMRHRGLCRRLSPLFNIDKGQPPMLIMHGLEDKVADPEQSVRLFEQYANAGNRADLILYPSYDHAFILFGYQEKTENVLGVLGDMDAWLCRMRFGDDVQRVGHEAFWQE